MLFVFWNTSYQYFCNVMTALIFVSQKFGTKLHDAGKNLSFLVDTVMNSCFSLFLGILPQVNRMKNAYCGNFSQFFLVIIMKKGPKTKWITSIEQIPNIIFCTIQHRTVVAQAYLKHPATY